MMPEWGNSATPRLPQTESAAAAGGCGSRLSDSGGGSSAITQPVLDGVASEMGWWALAEARRRRGRRRRQSKTREIVVATHTGLAAPSRTTVIASLS